MFLRHLNEDIKKISGCVSPEYRIWDGDRELGVVMI